MPLQQLVKRIDEIEIVQMLKTQEELKINLLVYRLFTAIEWPCIAWNFGNTLCTDILDNCIFLTANRVILIKMLSKTNDILIITSVFYYWRLFYFTLTFSST